MADQHQIGDEILIDGVQEARIVAPVGYAGVIPPYSYYTRYTDPASGELVHEWVHKDLVTAAV